MSTDPTAPLQTHPEAGASGRAALRPGTTLGRYVVVDRLGAGSGGTVYSAYDSHLGRKVALKVLRHDEDDPVDGFDEQLLREAQLIAALDHPNIVTVHDIGNAGQSTFIAMELVEGRDLADWQRDLDSGAGWRERLAPWLLAGRGLAAAHAGGVIHGDFKPANVLMGRDGRVRVSDFGVGRLRDADDPTLPDAETTTHGRLWGTPRYMAPELFEGRKPTEKSDLYSFAAAVYESLYDRPIAEAATVHELAEVKSRPVSLPSSPFVPRRVRTVLASALDPDPRLRPRDVRDVLAVLGHRRWSAVRTGAVVGAAGLAMGGVAWTQSLDDTRACDGAENRVAEVWNDSARDEVAAAFESAEASYAPEIWTRVAPVLDEYAASWATAHTETCEATRAGEQSEELLDAKMSCLARELVALDAFAGALGSGDAKALDNASRAAAQLQPASVCLAIESVNASLQPPAALAEHVSTVEDSFARIRAVSSLGRHDESQKLCKEAMDDATRIGFEPLIAKARYWSGRCLTQGGKWAEAGEELQGAAFAAEELGDDALAAQAGLSLMFLLSGNLDDSRAAVAWAPHAEVALKRAHATPRQWSRLHSTLALALMDLGKPDEAAAALDRANEFAARTELDAYARAELHERSGRLLTLRGEVDAAVGEFQMAYDTHLESNGPGHPNTIMAEVALADAQGTAGRAEEALTTYENIEGHARKTFGLEHPIYWSLQVNRSVSLDEVGRFEESIEIQEKAAAAFEKSVGREHPRYAGTLANLAATLGKAGRHKEAAEQAELAVPLLKRHYGGDHRIVGFGLGTWGAGLINIERWAEAIPPLEEALELRRRYPESEADTGEVEFALARALYHSGRDKKRGLRLARAALEGAKSDNYEPGIEAVTKWLDAR